MSKRPVLIINSYAGSLVIATKAAKHPIVASLEDAGYGMDIQRANFPKLDYRATTDEWPSQKTHVKDNIVLAHPPCAAFSSLTCGVDGRHGKDADAFQQTRVVVEYALGGKCAALALESVTGAYKGAKDVHEAMAKRFKYNVFHILQNASTFGLPQWRPRYWAIYIRKDLAHTLVPWTVFKKAAVGDILEKKPGAPPPNMVRVLERSQEYMRERLKPKEIKSLLRGDFGFGTLTNSIVKQQRTKGVEVTLEEALKEFCHLYFMANSPRVLDPDACAPTVLASSLWLVNGRYLSKVEFSRIMGYPDDYDFTPKYARRTNEFLSRGVCPPVAEWVLDVVNRTVEGKKPPRGAWTMEVGAGETYDMRLTKKQWATQDA